MLGVGARVAVLEDGNEQASGDTAGITQRRPSS